jgi:hypothetical protein
MINHKVHKIKVTKVMNIKLNTKVNIKDKQLVRNIDIKLLE